MLWRRKKRFLIVCLAISASVIALVMALGPLSHEKEPRYRDKTVTEWLDGIEFLHTPGSEGAWSYSYDLSPEIVTNHSSIRALVEVGSNAVPVLVKRLAEPAKWPAEVGFWKRLRIWMRWRWNQITRATRMEKPT